MVALDQLEALQAEFLRCVPIHSLSSRHSHLGKTIVLILMSLP
jgi:hypothetical protein